MRALDFDPQNRYPSAGAMATDLERAMRGLADEPIAPYAAGAAVGVADLPDGDDRTLLDGPPEDDSTLVAAPDPDDHTLLAPEPTARPDAAKEKKPPPANMPPAAMWAFLFTSFFVIVMLIGELWAFTYLYEIVTAPVQSIIAMGGHIVGMPEGDVDDVDLFEPVDDTLQAIAGRTNGKMTSATEV
jgi:hypothetical protein